MLRIKKIFTVAAISSAFVYSVFANESSQSHQKSVSVVNGIVTTNGELSVFSAGADGFLIKWLNSDLGEHYQISDLSIKLIAQSPNGKDVAVYETDGASFNRISVWDWSSQRRKFAYRFNDPISSLSYSAKGTYVICGTTAVNGAYFINSSTGKIESSKIKESIGTFSFSTTSASEKSFVVYSPIGSLTYYNLLNGEKKQKFYVEQHLTSVQMFNNSIFLAGLKDRKVFIVHALTGKTIGSFNANNAVLVSSSSENLYYIVNESRQFKLFEIKNENGKTVSNPQLIRTFSGLKTGENITSATISGENIIAGTNSGNIYKFDYEQAERVDVLQPITDDRYDSVLDVSPIESGAMSDFYVLTPASIYKTEFNEGFIERIHNNPGYKNMISYSDGLILWNKDSKKPIIKFDLSTGTQTTIFTPEGNIQTLKIFGDSLIDVESNSVINRYNLTNGKKETLYHGASIQDAVLQGENNLYIAKSSATSPNVPLLYVNTKTQETVPLSLMGTFAYALNYNSSSTGEIYGIVVQSKNGSQETSVFAFDVNKKTSRTLISTNEEDLDAFMFLDNGNLYTNVGKSSARSYNISTKRDFLYKRAESMPFKVVRNNDKIMVLNRNGSLSVYNANLNSILMNLYLDTDGQWNEM